MKKFILISCAATLFTSCYSPWNIGENKKVVMLPGVQAIVGRHCESSAIMNAVNYLGYSIPEHLITGAGGALAFSFAKETFPFLAARNADMREQFFIASGISWEKSTQSLVDSSDFGWKKINEILSEGFPVILRVDMRYLPYLYGGKYGPSYSSFGWHMVCLFGIDWSKNIAYVSDTALPGLQEISLKDLHKARSSKTKNMPPQGEFFWVNQKAEGYTPNYETMLQHSLRLILGYYEDYSLNALQHYGQDLLELESYSKQSFLLPAVLEYMAGNIEDFGTGGAAFRMLYRDYLQLTVEKLSGQIDSTINLSKLQDAIRQLDNNISDWHSMSDALRSLAARIKGMKADQRYAEYQKLQTLAQNIYKGEKMFYTVLKSVVKES